VSKKNKKGLSDGEIIRDNSELEIPVSVLASKILTTFEAATVYLKEQVGLNYHNMGVLLDRDERGMRIIYLRARDKLKGAKSTLGKYCRCRIPVSALRKRPLTTYEALVTYQKDILEYNYHEIAVLLKRDERDVRKVYLRAKDKHE